MKRLILIIFCLLILPFNALAEMRVIGNIAIPENKTSIVLTREHHSPKIYTGGIPQSVYDNAFNENEDMIAYVVYPNGPSCRIADSCLNKPAQQFSMGQDELNAMESVKSMMISIGYEKCDCQIVPMNDSFYLTVLATKEDISHRINVAYYSKNGIAYAITVEFDDYENIPVWNDYTFNFMSRIVFNVELLSLAEEQKI